VVQVKINIKREKYCSRRVYTNSRDIAMRGAAGIEKSPQGAPFIVRSARESERVLHGNIPFSMAIYIN
jgi:hypothetical protein